MLLRRSNNYSAIIENSLILFVLIVGAAIFTMHLILAGDWSGIFSSLGLAPAIFGLMFLVFLGLVILFACSYLYGLILRERMWRAAAQGDSHLLTTDADQPDQHLRFSRGKGCAWSEDTALAIS